MFALDPKLQARLRPHISRVLILEDNPTYARMLSDMFRILGSENVVVERYDDKAMISVEDMNPSVIITEFQTATINGLNFTRALRRSRLAARHVPVIMVKSDILPAHLTEARNAGVHEIMKRPFAWQDLLSRLKNVVFKSRDWIEAQSYVGPDRRRFNTGGDYTGARKRKGEAHNAARVAVEEAVRLMRVAVDLYDESPESARQTLFDQMSVIVPNAKQIPNREFIQTVGLLVAEMRTGKACQQSLEPIVAKLMRHLGMPVKPQGGWASRVLTEKMDESDLFLDGEDGSRAA